MEKKATDYEGKKQKKVSDTKKINRCKWKLRITKAYAGTLQGAQPPARGERKNRRFWSVGGVPLLNNITLKIIFAMWNKKNYKENFVLNPTIIFLWTALFLQW